MTAVESNNKNFFSTTLSAGITAGALSIPLTSLGGLTSPAYLVIDPKSDSKREVIYADGTWTGTTLVLTSGSSRGQDGSASGAQSHDNGTLVVSVPLSQHLADIHDRVDVHTHDGTTADATVTHADLGSLTADDHTNYLNTARHDVTARHPTTVLGDGSGLGLREVVTFTASGTFSKATYPWLRAVRVRVWGGGGSAGGTAATGAGENAASGGGGAGGYAEDVVLASALAASETVTVGAGGPNAASGNNNGNAGGASSFGTHAAANGGAGGSGSLPTASNVRSSGGNGGAGTAGDVQVRGGDGGYGQVIGGIYLMTATGGESPAGGGNPAPGNNVGGKAGYFPGGGGSGTTSTVSTGTRGGLAGADGLVVVELYA